MEPILRVEQVSKEFTGRKNKKFRGVGPVSLSLYPGETLGVVGESGCGKSTLAKIIMGVYKATEGHVFLNERPVDFTIRSQRLWFAQNVQMVFQDPMNSLNPKMTIGAIVEENLLIQQVKGDQVRKQRVEEVLGLVGLSAQHMLRFPHELSGGQRQRVGIARALAANPQLLICDEPISALDSSIQSQIVNLLQELKETLGLTYLFIAHDLSMVRYLSDRIAVLYAGRVVEDADTKQLFAHPLHPYTRMLLDAMLLPDPGSSPLEEIEEWQLEAVQDPSSKGCAFAPRCGKKTDQCAKAIPTLELVKERHFVACSQVKT